ncbi:MAG: hypothetical protein HUU14_05305 [Dehalococcoidia bacterium]|nr:hypothetical protein [Dehalococcoidia bacterium]MCL4230869.1 hypothetical protein [Dehalococcoidia bacterium]NUQ55285.1 hypothetical protein [Dehalococcoidia bacterium]
MLRDRPLTEAERARIQQLFEAHPSGHGGPAHKVRTLSQANDWYEHIADVRRYITPPV